MADKTEKPSISIKLSTHAEAAGNEGNTENAAEQQTLDAQTLMAEEEAKAKAKFGMEKPRQSQLLQRRISKGGKGQYFDSGDYNMSKAKGNKLPSVLSTDHPRPENIRQKKMSAPAVMHHGGHGGPIPIPKHLRTPSGGDGGHPPSKLSPPGVTS